MTGDEVAVRVRTHPGLCAGFGNCHRWAPHVYPLDADGRVDVHLLAVPAELAAEARLGAQVCPERAITVIEPTPARSRHSPGPRRVDPLDTGTGQRPDDNRSLIP